MHEIQEFLDNIVEYDWIAFNHLSDIAQDKEWDQMMSSFDDLLKSTYHKYGLDFRILNILIGSYQRTFIYLPYTGKTIAKTSNFLLSNKLKSVGGKFQFQLTLESEKPYCDCEIRSRFGEQPNKTFFTKLGKLRCAYYSPVLFQCPKCNFKWVEEDCMDSTGLTRFRKYDLKDGKVVE